MRVCALARTRPGSRTPEHAAPAAHARKRKPPPNKRLWRDMRGGQKSRLGKLEHLRALFHINSLRRLRGAFFALAPRISLLTNGNQGLPPQAPAGSSPFLALCAAFTPLSSSICAHFFTQTACAACARPSLRLHRAISLLTNGNQGLPPQAPSGSSPFLARSSTLIPP